MPRRDPRFRRRRRTTAGRAGRDPSSLDWQIKHGTGLVSATGIATMRLVPWLVGSLRYRRMYVAFGVAFASLVIQAVLHFFVHPDDGIRSLEGNLGLHMGPNVPGPMCGVFLVGTIVVISQFEGA